MGDCRLTVFAQAHRIRYERDTTIRKVAAFLLLAALTSGCASKGASLADAEVDRTLYTSNVADDPKAASPERVSDEATIRNAVSAMDLQGQSGNPLAWANTETGSRGAITALSETQNEGQLCRSFTTSRESYDGVAMYQGQACKAQTGAWRMLDFKPVQ